MNTTLLPTLAFALAAIATGTAHAAPPCPAAVTAAAKQAFPDATVKTCLAEGKIFEVQLVKPDRARVDVDLAADGTIQQIEEIVPVATVPDVVTKALVARYPRARAYRAERQTKADASVTFELAFRIGKARKEATFTSVGAFVDEE